MHRKKLTTLVFLLAMTGCATDDANQAASICLPYNQGFNPTTDHQRSLRNKAEKLVGRVHPVLVIQDGPEAYMSAKANAISFLDNVRKEAGECYPGTLVERIWTQHYKTIARWDKPAEGYIDKHRDTLEREANGRLAVARLPAEVRIQESGVARIELISADRLTFVLKVTNISVGKLLNPITYDAFAYDSVGSNGVVRQSSGTIPIGFTLSDEFENKYRLRKISPQVFKFSGMAIQPDDTRAFSVSFRGKMPRAAQEIVLTVERGALGNTADLTFKFRKPPSASDGPVTLFRREAN